MRLLENPKMKRLFRQSGGVLVSTLAVQFSAFVTLAIAARILPTEEFARLSLIVAVVMMSSAFFELGLNVTATKMFGESGDNGVFRVVARIRYGALALVICAGFIVFIWLGRLHDVAIALVLGAFLSIWNGMRAADQAMQQFRKFAKTSLLFSLIRLFVAFPFLFFFQNAVLVAVGLYLFPVLAIALFSGAWREVLGEKSKSIRTAEIIAYARFVYPNSILFIVLPYFPQLFIGKYLSSSVGGSYGLIMAFSGPVGLLIYSLRATLLPKMFGNGNGNGSGSGLEDAIWSLKGLAILACGWGFLSIFGIILAASIDYLYGDKFLDVQWAFLVYFVGFSLTGILGIYGLSIHTLGVPQLSLYVNFCRVLALILGLFLFGSSLMGVVLVVSVVMVAGEIALVFLVLRCRRGVGK